MTDQLFTFVRSASQAEFKPRLERIEAGKRLREKVAKSEHGKLGNLDRDPIKILEESNQGRIPELIPIRYGRMLRSPFSFMRGSSALMAYDLATYTPNTGIVVQACGDCHMLNFGLFATPERNLVFDLNDFDETLPAPWEWDLKRLATSFVVAGRENKVSDEDCKAAAMECVYHYHKRLDEYSHMSPVELWYKRLDIKTMIDMAPDNQTRKLREDFAERARKAVIEHHFPKITNLVAGRHRFIDQPPLVYHVVDENWEEWVQDALESYRSTLSDERKVLLDRYRIEDIAMKVVGIGSVGTRCYIALFFSEDNKPLVLQIKEARRSALESYTAKSVYENQGERVVMGQRLMQSSSDIFLGWLRGRAGRDFYVRQLRDMKYSIPVEGISGLRLRRYAEFCGWTLARSHAKSGDAATISGYIGKNDKFDRAIGDFAMAYADQTLKDYDSLVQAVKSSRLEALND